MSYKNGNDHLKYIDWDSEMIMQQKDPINSHLLETLGYVNTSSPLLAPFTKVWVMLPKKIQMSLPQDFIVFEFRYLQLDLCFPLQGVYDWVNEVLLFTNISPML